ncbi:MAG: two-component sensor histidine kinase [Burkholderiales bacterium]|nr:two-component sensor histidine kinase [Burkholderiales bacterium]
MSDNKLHSTRLTTADSVGSELISPSVKFDLIVVIAVTISTFIVSSLLELNERLIALTRPLEAYQIDELPTTLVAMIAALAWFSWRRSRQLIEQANLRLAAQRELADALAENKRLSQRYLQVQEEERRFLARELHDELGQSLNAIKVDAVNIRDAATDAPEVKRSAQAIIDVSSKVYEVVRTLLRQLRPVALDELGLASAVQYSVEEWQRRHIGIDCSLSIEGDFDDLTEDINITAYRFVQECLTNVARHAEATHVTVSMRRSGSQPRTPKLELAVEDDGRGVDRAVTGDGLGLIGLRERVEALGGRFRIEGQAGAGTRVFAAIPLAAVSPEVGL